MWLLSVLGSELVLCYLAGQVSNFTAEADGEGRRKKNHTSQELHLRFIKDDYFMCVLTEGRSSCLTEVTLCFVIPGLTKLGSQFFLNILVILSTKHSQKMNFLKREEARRNS